MARHLYENFEEVEEHFKENAPNTIYKYRSDWDNPYHREFVAEQKIWFAHPKELNDPHDIRTPVKFNFEQIENPLFLEKMKKSLQIINPGIAYTERELDILSERKLNEIRKDPKKYFEANQKAIREGTIYDIVGVFSCTTDDLNKLMWANYANNHTGFAVGFNSVKFSRSMNCGIGWVKYNDEIPEHDFLKEPEGDMDDLFLKSTNWGYEKEFRFVTLGIQKNSDRIKIYSTDSVEEFLLGEKFSDDKKSEFIDVIRTKFPSTEIPIYQVESEILGFGMKKIRLA